MTLNHNYVHHYLGLCQLFFITIIIIGFVVWLLFFVVLAIISINMIVFCFFLLAEIDIVLETDEDSDIFTTENNPAGGIQEAEPGVLAELSADKESSADHPLTRKRSWIWRHFEPLDGSARCRICSERLQACKGGSTGNLHRHMSAKHPQVFRSPQSPPSTKRSLSGNDLYITTHLKWCFVQFFFYCVLCIINTSPT